MSVSLWISCITLSLCNVVYSFVNIGAVIVSLTTIEFILWSTESFMVKIKWIDDGRMWCFLKVYALNLRSFMVQGPLKYLFAVITSMSITCVSLLFSIYPYLAVVCLVCISLSLNWIPPFCSMGAFILSGGTKGDYINGWSIVEYTIYICDW